MDNKWGIFAIGVCVGLATAAIAKTPAFRKACAAVVGAGFKLRDEAAVLAQSIKEDAEDIVAEAKYQKVDSE